MVKTKVTAELLEKMGASCSQLERFKETWPDGVEITLENCLKAVRLDFDLNWFACRFLETNAWAEYAKALSPDWAEYQKAEETAWAEYAKAEATALAEYGKVLDVAWANYEKAKATAFYNAYLVHISQKRSRVGNIMEIALRHCNKCKRMTLQVPQRVMTLESSAEMHHHIIRNHEMGYDFNPREMANTFAKLTWYCPQCGKRWIEVKLPVPPPYMREFRGDVIRIVEED